MTTDDVNPQMTAPEADLAAAEPPHPNRDKAHWFVLKAMSGQENKVATSILKRLKQEEMAHLVHEAIVPSETVSEIKRNKKIETRRRLYPGYVFVLANLYDDDRKLIERTWYYLTETEGVMGFVDGEKPQPMRQSDVDGILAQMQQGEDRVVPKAAFAVGDKVKVGDGPFLNQDGIVEEVHPETGRMKVSVNLFGRNTMVDLEYWQVEKA